MTIKLLVTAVVAMVIIIEDSHENLAINPVLTLVQLLAQDFIITTFIFSNHSPYCDRSRSRFDQHYKNSSRSNYSSRPYNNSTSSHSPYKLYPRSLNAPLSITIPLSDAINHHTALLLNQVPIPFKPIALLLKEVFTFLI